MAIPVSNSVSNTGNYNINRLLEGGSWILSGNRVITYSLHSPEPGSIWTATEVQAVDAAFASWEAVANIDFKRVGGPDSYNPFTSPADIAVIFTGYELSSLIAPGLLGLGNFPDPTYINNIFLPSLSFLVGFNVTRSLYPHPEGDIFIDDFSGSWFPYLYPGGTGFTTIVHEIGHALGLSHPGINGNGNSWNQLFSIMSYNSVAKYFGVDEFPSIGQPATPMPYDILAIQHIYGANNSYHTGNNKYVLQDDGIVKTIWDAGGIDVFDASAMTTPVIIDLGQGGYSFTSLYSVTAIAFKTVIENAKGGSDDDLIYGNSGKNTLIGNGGNDLISGLGGNDILKGGSGSDTLKGGPGNDIYIVDSADSIIENKGNGIDLVKSTDSYNLGNNLEKLTLLGTSNINGTGNGLKNTIIGNKEDNILKGLGNNDILKGRTGDDVLQGGNGNDKLIGQAGNDNLNGGPGSDHMSGGGGNDIYIVNSSNDIVTELTNSGIDTVKASITYNLNNTDGAGPNGGNVENLKLIGTKNINGIGNNLNNTIEGNNGNNLLKGNNGNDSLFGNGGDDILNGGKGHDTLKGGEGSDILNGGGGPDDFIFDSLIGIDTIKNFNLSSDKINLEITTFSTLGSSGTLNPDYFISGPGVTAAVDSNDHILFDTDTGALYYDADGAGGANAIQFAILNNDVISLTADNIIII